MNRIFTFVILLALAFAEITNAQNLHRRFDGMPVIVNGSTCINPFNGGLETPRYQFADIDGDSDLDLFIYDKDTTLNFYRNEGSSSSGFFRLVSTRYENLNIRNWFEFADLDSDGDKDLLCGGDSQRVRYYKNIGSAPSPNYMLQTYGVKTDLGEFMGSESASSPTLADVDGDGDLDFMSGTSTGEVTYYQNIGTAQNYNFKFITGRFANILIVGGADDPRHGASAIRFADIDGDSDKDLFWGDLFGFSIYFIKNTGTAQNFQWTVIDTTSPEPNPYYSGGFNMPGIYDINNDGRNDFFVTVLIGSKPVDNFVYYRNEGPLGNPSFTQVTENFILSADMGSYSAPCFSDIDNDGDKDLFMGNDHSVAFFRNTGTAASPQLTLVTDSLPLNISNFNYTPALGDLDGDGKKDMVVGYFALAKLKFFKNTGTVQNPVFTFTASQMDTMNLQQSSAPALADLDNDGDLDLLAGNSGGKLTYHRNIGTPQIFNFQFISNNYMNVTVGNDAAPSLGDVDGDGDLDLLVGNRLGQMYFYRNTGSITSPNFEFVTNSYAGIYAFQNSTPFIVDINGDSDPDVFCGNTKGGLYYYENWDVFGLQQIGTGIPEEFSLMQNYPNPFNPATKIRFQVPSGTSGTNRVKLSIFDITGKEIRVLTDGVIKAGMYEADFNAAELPSGVYFYRLVSGSFSQSKKMILLK